MDKIRYKSTQAGLIQAALMAHLNHYKRSLEETADENFRSIAKDKIEKIENMMKEIGA